jgi:chemotaxis signal transduction protein
MIQTAGELRRAFDASFAEPYPAGGGAQIGLLLLSIGDTAYALALEQIGAIHVDLRIGPVPSRERTLVGLATVRNVIIPVHDLAVALGLRAQPVPARWAVVSAAEPVRAWAFDQFEGQIRIDRAARTNGTVEIAGRSRRVLDLEELRDAA